MVFISCVAVGPFEVTCKKLVSVQSGKSVLSLMMLGHYRMLGKRFSRQD